MRLVLLIGVFLCSAFSPGLGQEDPPSQFVPPDSTKEAPMSVEAMTIDRPVTLIEILDQESKRTGNVIEFTIKDTRITLVADPAADRMRLVVGIAREDVLTPELMKRLLQANFDTTLDSRYGIAQGILWATFLHPLSSLSEGELISGIVQTVNVALTYGSDYTSGLFTFGGGDSGGILKEELERCLRDKEDPV